MERKFVRMADRFFRNEMPDFVAEIALDETVSTESAKDSLTKLLYLPYTTLSERLKRSALDLKETVFHFFEFLRSIFFFMYLFLCLILGNLPTRLASAHILNYYGLRFYGFFLLIILGF